jgi:condensin complex subunit 2
VEPTNPSDPRVFDSVITNLRKSYPKEKMEEISTSFCFICLLHLANEKGLKIEVGDDGSGSTDIEEGDNRVGDIWGLKVTS